MDKAKFQALEATLSNRTPYCSGTCNVPALYFNLFYNNRNEAANQIDLSKATNAELKFLSQACQPATFGIEQQDILDETYRKAGKLDLQNFATHFDPTRTGIVEHIADELLVGDQKLELELYKLNVYEKEGFFKSHKDTPRGERMFGSLVVVFPTQHEGGELILRQEGNEWTVDFSDAFKEATQPCVGYVAFFSDIEHEVARVLSGYRVTLTYNLYFASAKADLSVSKPLPNAVPPQQQNFEAALIELINNPTVLPQGGYLGFNFQHQYPVQREKPLSNLKPYLKGPDAVLAGICGRLSLKWFVKVLYKVRFNKVGLEIRGNCFLCMDKVPAYDGGECDNILEWMKDDGAQIVNFMTSKNFPRPDSTAPAPTDKRDPSKDGSESDSDFYRPEVDFLSVTDIKPASLITTRYIAYGNDAQLDHIYGHLCLAVQLDPADKRK